MNFLPYLSSMKFLWLFLFVLFSGIAFSQSDEDTTIYEFVDQQAEFPGGYSQLMKHIIKNINYQSNDSEPTNKIYLRFVVEVDGTISKVSSFESFKEPKSEKLLELKQDFPKWTPATLNGKIVRSYVDFPITIHYN